MHRLLASVRRESANFVMLGGLLAVVVAVLMALAKLVEIQSSLADVLARSNATAPNSKDPMQLTETVTGNGRSVVVTTILGENETVDACIARHNANVAAVQASLQD